MNQIAIGFSFIILRLVRHWPRQSAEVPFANGILTGHFLRSYETYKSFLDSFLKEIVFYGLLFNTQHSECNFP